jgi:hypothetical protein
MYSISLVLYEAYNSFLVPLPVYVAVIKPGLVCCTVMLFVFCTVILLSDDLTTHFSVQVSSFSTLFVVTIQVFPLLEDIDALDDPLIDHVYVTPISTLLGETVAV